MAFKDSLRLEEIYFKNLKTMIERLKRFEGSRNTKELKEIIDALIECCSAILMLYRNLGEEYNELTAQIQKNVHDLEDLKNTVEAYNGEINEKIDEINNYLMVLIRELDGRVTALEAAVENLEDAVEDLETDVSGIQTDITNFGGLPSNASAAVGDVLTKGADGNEWSTPQGGVGVYEIELRLNTQTKEFEVYHNNVALSVNDLKTVCESGEQIIAYENRITSIEGIGAGTKKIIYELVSHSIFTPDNDTFIILNLKNVETIDLRNKDDVFYNVYCNIYNIMEIVAQTHQEDEFIIVNAYLVSDYDLCIMYDNVDTNDDIMNANIDYFYYLFPIDQNENAESDLFNNPQKLLFISKESMKNVNVFILSIENTTTKIDQSWVEGIKVTFTDFTFTNNILNTRSLFIYRDGIIDWNS